MKKSYPFNVMSEKRCSCGKLLKRRIAEEHPKFDKCYPCHIATRCKHEKQ